MDADSGSLRIGARLLDLPVESCELDRSVELRFDYSVEDLAEDIRQRGQLQPVLAYQKAGRYWIFVGMRRYMAIKKLHEAYGKPEAIKALVLEREPSEEEKLEMALSENLKRNELNIYEKIAIALSHPGEAERMISKHFAREVKLLMPNVTVLQLRRWFEIEKALGGVRLKLPHLEAVSQLKREEQDFAVFFFHVFNIPEDVSRFNLRKLFSNTPLGPEERRMLEKLGIRPPGELLHGAQEEIHEKKEGHEGAVQPFEAKHGSYEEREEAPPDINYEEPDVLLMSEKVQALVLSGRVYVLYLESQPEVFTEKVQDGQEIEIEGSRYRVRVLL